jgi:hypothetical protein
MGNESSRPLLPPSPTTSRRRGQRNELVAAAGAKRLSEKSIKMLLRRPLATRDAQRLGVNQHQIDARAAQESAREASCDIYLARPAQRERDRVYKAAFGVQDSLVSRLECWRAAEDSNLQPAESARTIDDKTRKQIKHHFRSEQQADEYSRTEMFPPDRSPDWRRCS